jgi:nitroimidazol reductase NimA-like FMN-containing flavoprotein (pyridoxamine 5'-phosphate oxidase superfamily)
MTTEKASSYRPLRRKAKEVTDKQRIDAFLRQAHVGYLGLADGEGTYVVPLNFVWHQGKIYYHGSEEGRKADAIKKAGVVCFTVFEEIGITCDPVPAKTGTAFFSVMVFGRVSPVNDLAEATDAMQAMLDKYVPGYFPGPLPTAHVERYRSSMGSKTMVFRIDPVRITAKEDATSDEHFFYPGRKQADDLRKSRR